MDIHTIKERLKKIKDATIDHPVLFQHTVISNETEEKILSHIIDQKDIFYMRFPKKVKTYIGCGREIEFTINSREELKDLKNKKYDVDHNLDNQDPLIFGSTSFNIDTPSKTPWKDYSKGTFFIPTILFTYTKDETHLTFSKLLNKKISVNSIVNEIKEYIELFKEKSPSKKNNKKLTLSNKQLIPEKEEYIKSVQSIINKIHRGELDKTVLSRMEKYTIKDKISINKIIVTLNNHYSNCFNFLIEQRDGNYFLGSSPEKLIEVNENKINTLALAGTSKHKISLKREKEIREHSYVVEYLKRVLDQYVDDLYIERDAKPLKLDYAYHIQTPITGRLKEQTHIIDIMEKLYPTPALAGTPMKDSLDIISSIEKFDRGLYGGCIGVYNNKGYGNFYVAIRSALIKNNKIFFFSGSGIVEKSIAEKEWDETNLKLEHLKSVL